LGFGAQGQLWVSGRDGGDLFAQRADRVSQALAERFEKVLESGEGAVQDVRGTVESRGAIGQDELSRIRRRWSVSALAVYDAEGRPQAWVGVHRGRVPGAIRQAETPYSFAGGPLFRYLYFTVSLPEPGGTAVAAILLQANLPGGLEGSGVASRFKRETGIPIQILPPHRVAPDRAVLDLGWENDPLLRVEMAEMAPEELWAPRVRFWVRWVSLFLLLAWGLLAVGAKGFSGHQVGAGLWLLALVLLIPSERVWPGVTLSSPAQFLLPGPLGIPLGQLLALLAALGVLAGLFPLRPRAWASPLVAGATVAIAFPALEGWIREGASAALLAGGVGGFLPYQLSLALSLSLAAYFALAVRAEVGTGAGRGGFVVGGVVLASVLSFALGLLARSGPGVSPLLLAPWGVAAFLAARGLAGKLKGKGSLTWALAAVLGISAAVPAAWGTQIQARMAEAEAQLSDLGAEPDPYLEFRLHELAEFSDSLDAIISSPVELLFEIWASTGRYGEPIPMWITLWSPGDLPQEDLSMGVHGPRPPEVDDFLEEVRAGGRPLIRHLGLEDGRYVLLVPLEGDRVLSACVPPPGSASLSSALGPIFAAMGQPGLGRLNLVPVPMETPAESTPVTWELQEAGWRGSTLVHFPGGGYSAHQTVSIPKPSHMLARGTLAIVLDLFLILAIWGLGRTMSRGREVQPREALRILGSFRAKVTLALFGFFFLSIAIFGTLAFQTLSGAAERTASAVAERLVEDGALGYLDVSGQMELLAQQVGADLLEYRDGELIDGSAEELVELGLYEGWVPEPLFRTLEGRTEVRATYQSSLARWAYVMAFRRLPDGDILGTPVPVEAGATALRRQEVADLLGFAIVLGAALSLGLAFLVGGTLTRPIETLQVASERVGAGNLNVRLPANRNDEFGSVFGAFNRMVQGIRRARRALLRTTQRTKAIVEEAATGVVALDSSGRVTLANPRAETLLKEEIQVGESLPGRDGSAAELVRWVDLYFRDGIHEANTEFQLGPRRIRVRARRVTGEGPLGGAVLSLEDVTDELRTERILAWGEMAQQVAHEVKNPLTPIKLSVQHLQRAWEDRRADFGDILGKNIGVILREIEHLAAIAKSFSRFGAPQTSGEMPLESVDVGAVTEEVMNLYRGGEGALDFQTAIPPGLPLVQARESELREVLINLLENSRAAITEEGRVLIRAESLGHGVDLRVRDNGKGIPTELLSRIFEPHFSTRSTGTGLGLAIVRRLVESWGATVTVESEVGVGTEIEIVLVGWEEGEKGSEESG
jgi:signal transduction histidine kinase/HAMP domain-containing protein